MSSSPPTPHVQPILAIVLLLCAAGVNRVEAQELSSLSGNVSVNAEPVNRARVMVLKPDLADTLAVLFTSGTGHFEGAFVANVGTESTAHTAADKNEITALYPNPIAPGQREIVVAFRSASTSTSQPTVEVFDVLGRQVRIEQSVASGIYFIRLRFDETTVSSPRSLVVTSAGRLSLVVRRDTDPLPHNAGSFGKAASAHGITSSATSALIRVEKDGLITQEAEVDLDPSTPTIIDFTMSAASEPTAAFTVSGSLKAGEPTLFDASASAGANDEDLRYTWSFANGQMGTGRKIAHVYTGGGVFDVALTVVGDYGAKSTTTHEIVIADPPAPVATNGKLRGRVRDIDGFGLPDVQVTIVGSDRTGTSDLSGAVLVENVDVGVALAVRLRRTGYASQVVKLGVPSDTTSTLYFEAALRPRDNVMEVDEAENGFVLSARDGVRVEMPFDALQRADGSPVSGQINVSMTPVDVGDTTQVGSFPGRFEGVTPIGNVTPIVSFGVAEFAFEQNGEQLQLAAGKTARVEIPIYTTGAAVGDSIPSWSMNETTGSWVQEAMGIVKESPASPSGLALSVDVGHFTWWNCDAEPDERNEGTGLCFKYECFAGICNKVKVYCWVEGAQRGNLDKRDDLPPPVFTVREFWPEASGTFTIPGNVVTTMRATTFQGDVVLRGDTTFLPVGGGTSSIELILDTVATASELTLPTSVTGTLEAESDIHFYTFHGVAGQLIAFDFQALGSPAGNIQISDPMGTVLQDRSMDGIARPMVLTETGAYTVSLTGVVASPTSYVLRIYVPSGTVDVNSNTTISLPGGDFRILKFDAELGQTLNAAFFQPEFTTFAPRNRLIVFDSTLSFSRANSSSNSLESGDFVANSESLYLLVESNTESGEVTFGLTENDPQAITVVQFDSNGAVNIDDTLPYHGGRKRYTFDAVVGDGIDISFHQRGADSLLEARFTIVDPAQNILSATPSSGKPGYSLSGHAFKANATGTYELVVDDRQFSSRGDFVTRIRKVAPAAAIVVDDDMTCSGATTTSLTAALLAISVDGIVTICNGTYEATFRPILRTNGVTVAGESEDGVIISYYDTFRSPGTIMEVQGVGVTVRDLTIESEVIGFNYNIGIRSSVTLDGNSASFRNLTFRPRGNNAGMGPAIDGQYTTISMENITYTHGIGGTQSLNVSAADSIRVRNVSIDYPANLRGSDQDGVVVEIDDIEVHDYTLQVQGASEVVVENSTITGNIEVLAAGEAVVRNNVFETDAAYALKVIGSDDTLVEGNESNKSISVSVAAAQQAIVRNNTLRTTASGSMLTLSSTSSTSGGTIVAQNNIIAGLRGPLVTVHFPEYFADLTVANNTIVHEQFGNTSENVESVTVRAANPSYVGDLSVRFVNNIFVGDATTVFNLLPGTTIDSNYNIYTNYLHILTAGTNRTGGNDLLGANPMFANTDFELLVGSPAIDAGATPVQYPGVPVIDFHGNSRPVGAGYDIGAFEGSVSGTAAAGRGN